MAPIEELLRASETEPKAPRDVVSNDVGSAKILKALLELGEGADLYARITKNFEVSETMMIPKGCRSTIYSDSPGGFTITRGATFKGYLFNSYNNGIFPTVPVEMTLKNITIDGNKKDVPNADSMLYVAGTTKIEEGTVLTNGSSSIGGAIKVSGDGNLIINGGTITGNQAIQPTNAEAARGGAIYIQKGNVTINGGTISENKAIPTIGSAGGGALYCISGTVTVNGGTFINNEAVSSPTISAGGGAIGIYDASAVSIIGGSFINNKVTATASGVECLGGALHIDITHGPIVIGNKDTNNGPLFRENKADGNGGAISVSAAANTTFTMYGGELTGNTATINGGAMTIRNIKAAPGKYYIKSGLFKDNKAISSNGGGIYFLGGDPANSLEIGDPAINVNKAPEFYLNNAAENGGALFLQASGVVADFWLRRAYIHENTAKFGAGIYINNSYAIRIGDVANAGYLQPIITKNTASSTSGGIYITAFDSLKFISGSISYNIANSTAGMNAAKAATAKSPIFEMGAEDISPPPEIVGNVSLLKAAVGLAAGGLATTATEFRMISGRISGNQTASGGGGILVSNKAVIGGKDPDNIPEISDNVAALNGGGIAMSTSSASAELYIATEPGTMALITNNKAGDMGGGISTNMIANNDAYLKNIHIGKGAIFSGNTANRANYYIDERQQGIYDSNIDMDSYSTADPPFKNGYNNYDIAYAGYRVRLFSCDGQTIYETHYIKSGRTLPSINDPAPKEPSP